MIRLPHAPPHAPYTQALMRLYAHTQEEKRPADPNLMTIP